MRYQEAIVGSSLTIYLEMCSKYRKADLSNLKNLSRKILIENHLEQRQCLINKVPIKVLNGQQLQQF